MSCLCRYYGGFTSTTQFLLQFHHIPVLLGYLFHLVEYLKLTVEQEECVVGVCHTTYHSAPYSLLVVLRRYEGSLGATVLGEQVAKEINIPGCHERQVVGSRHILVSVRTTEYLRQ